MMLGRRHGLELDIEERPAIGRGEDRGQGGDADGAEGGSGRLGDLPRLSLDTDQRRIVDHDRDAVGRGPDVELEAIAGGDRHGGLHRFDGVLRRRAPVASVGEPKGPSGHRSPTRSRAGPRGPGGRSGRASGPRGPDGRTRAARLDADGAADPDVVEALREAVGVHRRRLEARWPGHGRIGAVRVGVRGSVARREHPLDRRLGRIGVEVAHDDPGIGRPARRRATRAGRPSGRRGRPRRVPGGGDA